MEFETPLSRGKQTGLKMLGLVGKKLGKYRIISKIGQGGMAIVYKATDTTLQRAVALKVMLPHLATDAGFVKRFQHEAITAVNLKHPHIVTIYEVGEQEGIYYIAMEYVPGRTLQQIIKQAGMLSLERTVKLFNQIADALTYAHHQGLIHRDIKPSNILVDAEDNVTLTDFGIAKAAQYVTVFTGPGRLVGTPQYMSPEHAEGRKLDHRSDIYALGVVLYEMLAGKVPFSGKTPTPILYAHVYKKPPSPRHVNPKIPKLAEKVILKALAKRPGTRYQSAVEMAEGFRQRAERAQRAGGAALLFGVVETILDLWETRRPVLPASIAVLLVLGGLFLGRGWLVRSVGGLAGVWSPAPTPTVTAAPIPRSTITATATRTRVPSPSSVPTTEVPPAPIIALTAGPSGTMTTLPTHAPRAPVLSPPPVTPTPTRETPTATPVTPTATPETRTPIPAPTPTLTATPAPTATPTATRAATQTPTPVPAIITLSEPANGARVSGPVTFRWAWSGEFREGETFDVKVCKGEGCQPQLGITNTKDFATYPWCPDAGEGVYGWQVMVIDGQTMQPKGPTSEVWEFTWKGGCGRLRPTPAPPTPTDTPPPTPTDTPEPTSTPEPTPTAEPTPTQPSSPLPTALPRPRW